MVLANGLKQHTSAEVGTENLLIRLKAHIYREELYNGRRRNRPGTVRRASFFTMCRLRGDTTMITKK